VVTDIADVPVSRVDWPGAVRIIRSIYPPIDLYEDIADPEDWPLLIAAEQKTNPRLMETIGNLDLVPPKRRVSGQGASFLMAPFTHVSPDRPSRFSDGTYGALYAGKEFGTALFETIYHHEVFMARTNEEPGWTSQFREIVVDVGASLHDLRGANSNYAPLLNPNDQSAGRIFGKALKAHGSDGVVYPSVRHRGGACVGLFYPDSARNPRQGRHLDYHWDGEQVDIYRDAGGGEVFRIT
jgi:RES domain